MSAQIPSTMPLSDLLKSTGYDCPEELQGKTFEEATSGGGDISIETNTEKTIDVSAYTEPVVIEPSEGYDVTKKVTVTLSNIPSPIPGGSAALYAWIRSDGSNTKVTYFDFSVAPDDFTSKHILDISDGVISIKAYGASPGFDGAAKVSDTEFTVAPMIGSGYTYTRDNTKDVTIWG